MQNQDSQKKVGCHLFKINVIELFGKVSCPTPIPLLFRILTRTHLILNLVLFILSSPLTDIVMKTILNC